YILTTLLLIYVLIFGKDINGAKAWIHLSNIAIQPSEFAKISLIMESNNGSNLRLHSNN
ncbi:MAG: FtsW/RodA/SpoVE family cell cycle protein, partial [Methanobrevibacter sp.]|nr:FtsW/RodA/SpoVE family cell cycle protein [Methanobrevibacter sp.]